MKKLTMAILLFVSLAVISGCAQATKAAGQQVKCPACGYSFNLHDAPGN